MVKHTDKLPEPVLQPVMQPLTPYSCFTPTTLPIMVCTFPPKIKPTTLPVQICFPTKSRKEPTRKEPSFDGSRETPDASAPFIYAEVTRETPDASAPFIYAEVSRKEPDAPAPFMYA